MAETQVTYLIHGAGNGYLTDPKFPALAVSWSRKPEYAWHSTNVELVRSIVEYLDHIHDVQCKVVHSNGIELDRNPDDHNSL